MSGSRITVQLHALSALIRFAYDIKPYQLPGAAALDRTYYDIVADVGDGRPHTTAEFRLLMESLLVDRFKLRVHREDKEMPVYALVVGKEGLKLKETAAPPDPDIPPKWHFTLRPGGSAFILACPACTIEQFATYIRDNDGMDRPVINKTGLTGTYNISITYVPTYRMGHGQPTSDDVDIFTAIKDLGLRLESQKASIEILTVDHYEKPETQ